MLLISKINENWGALYNNRKINASVFVTDFFLPFLLGNEWHTQWFGQWGRDTRSRWGSCTITNQLKSSWAHNQWLLEQPGKWETDRKKMFTNMQPFKLNFHTRCNRSLLLPWRHQRQEYEQSASRTCNSTIQKGSENLRIQTGQKIQWSRNDLQPRFWSVWR